jgi:hypothetical protein
MGTFVEADFCLLRYLMRHIYSMKREGASEGFFFFFPIVSISLGSSGQSTLFSPEGRLWDPA